MLESRLDESHISHYQQRFTEQNNKLNDYYYSLPRLEEFDEQEQQHYVEVIAKMWGQGEQ
jgi:hypothetical protein